jgi:glycine dehydrogenase subunit 1
MDWSRGLQIIILSVLSPTVRWNILSKRHPLLPNLDETTIAQMLRRMGATSIDELFADIPDDVRLKRPLRIPEGQPEYNVKRELQSKLISGGTPSLCFLGGGVWPHYVPAVVESIVARQEFYTSYTPYQPEVSQGMLQALYEYQSLMCDLLGMEACNSSLYDWASAAAEAARMAVRVTGRKILLLGGNVGPERAAVIRSYVQPLGLTVATVPFDSATGELDLGKAEKMLTQDVAGFYFENPNYFGIIEEDAAALVEAAHRSGSLAVVGVDPVSLSLVKEPGAYGADIAVGEGQPLGISMNFGGPHLGIFSVKNLKLARSMPGRLIGMTSTVSDPNQKAFAMVLQTREQHIRREAATSNVCTNQSLMALAAASYLALLGKSGFRKLGEAVISNSHFAAQRLSTIKGLESPYLKGPFFKEFVVAYEKASAEGVFKSLAKRGVFAGYPVASAFGLGAEAGLFCVTEVHTSADIDALAEALEEVV